MIGKFCLDRKENKDAMISAKSKLTSEMLEELYDVFIDKMQNSVYAKRLRTQVDKLTNANTIFYEMTNEQKAVFLSEILHLFQCNSQTADLKAINGGESAGSIKITNDITKSQQIHIINQSITGFYEQVIDLKTI